MIVIPDNYDQFVQYDKEQLRQLERLPQCIICGDYITQDTAFQYDDGLICDVCLDGNRVPVCMDDRSK